MDYIDHCTITNHKSWDDFDKYCKKNKKRIILATTKTTNSFYKYQFKMNDIILFGKETAGVPEFIHQEVNEKITIPINGNTRSLNLATSVAMIATRVISTYK